tara:strand:- start:883 stop:1434 length:552 start_codon:yes stop_codon:yes gene_type:complete
MIKDDLIKIAKRDFEWLITTLGSASLFLGALFYEHVFGMAPCYLCVQQRALILGIFLSSVVGYMFHLIKCKHQSTINALPVIFFAGLSLVFASYAYDIAVEHLASSGGGEFSFLFSTCDGGEPFPSYLPLDKWLPFFFSVKASCDDGIAKAFSLEMPVYVQFFSMLVTVLSCVKITFSLDRRN